MRRPLRSQQCLDDSGGNTQEGSDPRSLSRPGWYPLLLASLGLVILSAVYWLALHFIFERGLSSADDSFFALVAKELAEHGRYALPHSSEFVHVFDPTIGSGPALIVPGAFMLWLAGTHVWVPGVTVVGLSMLQGVLIVLALRRPVANALLFYAGTLLLVMLVGHYQWYLPMFVGEMPAFGFTLLGSCLLVASPLSTRRSIAAGLAFGMALMAKQLALVAVVGVLTVWTILAFRAGGRVRVIGRSLVTLGGALVVPLAAFEAIKFVTLGPDGYARALAEQAALTKSLAVGTMPFAQRLSTFSTVLDGTYQVDLAVLVCFGLAVTLAVVRRGASPGARMTLLLGGGAVSMLAYVLVFSIMWPRYFYIGTALGAAAIAAPLVDRSRRVVLGWLCILMVAIATPTQVSATWSLWLDGPPVARELAAVQQELGRHRNLVIVSRWWGTFYDVAFQLPESRRWMLLSEVDRQPAQPFLFVNNETFAPKDEADYQALRSTCELLLSAGQYRVQRCEPGGPSAGIPSATTWDKAWQLQQPGQPAWLRSVRGLDKPEDFGRWSVGPEIALEFAAPLPRRFTLELLLGGFGPNVGKSLTVIVGAVSRNIAIKSDLMHMQTYTIAIDNPEASRVLKVVIPAPATPASVGIPSADARALGVAIQTLQIRPDR
jgi:hypothetical protein